MASPHVAGLAAYFLSLEGEVTPEHIMDKILRLAAEDALKMNPIYRFFAFILNFFIFFTYIYFLSFSYELFLYFFIQ
jgi:hypothetical protein